ncbi:hypothetical protein ACHAW6_004688 [Cyclotella cf. meneghiniana]
MRILSSLFLLIALAGAATASSIYGKGALGIHPINDRYIAVADSSIDAVLILDGHSAGAVVGHFVLHDRRDDPTDADSHIGTGKFMPRWVDPLSLSTCDACKHVFLTSANALYKIVLERPLAQMAAAHDFSAFTTKSTIAPYWPKKWDTSFKGDGNLRTVSVASDGSSAYVAHMKAGVFSFDPLNPVESDEDAVLALAAGGAGIDGEQIVGLHHTESLKNLILTSADHVHFVSIKDANGKNPLELGKVIAYSLPLDYHCNYLYPGNDMTFTDTVIINDYAFVIGHPTLNGVHNGVAMYRLTWKPDEEQWHECIQVAGSGLASAAWVDGDGKQARFSHTPHDIAVLPSLDSHTIVVADADNRALRYVDVTVPVEADDDSLQVETVRVASIPYNEDLWAVLYKKEDPWSSLTPETVMESDGKSYYRTGSNVIVSMNYEEASAECTRVGVGRVCSLPEIRARFARGQYPTRDESDSSWTTVWTNEVCASCHLNGPGACSLDGGADSWGQDYKMVANFNAKRGLVVQCTKAVNVVPTMSMCCGLGGPAVLNPQPTTKSLDAAQKGRISAGVIIPIVILAVALGLFMRRRAKPIWWPKMFRSDRREETGHAPHREVDLRGRDYI